MSGRSITFACPVACILLLTAASAPCLADTLRFHATLRPQMEVPAVTSAGSGDAMAVLDTTSHLLTYDLMFHGFASGVSMAHFHGPARAGENAGVQVPLGTNPGSPVHGSVTLTAEQEKQLVGGLWYVNVHTANHPNGAARGQLLQSP